MRPAAARGGEEPQPDSATIEGRGGRCLQALDTTLRMRTRRAAASGAAVRGKRALLMAVVDEGWRAHISTSWHAVLCPGLLQAPGAAGLKNTLFHVALGLGVAWALRWRGPRRRARAPQRGTGGLSHNGAQGPAPAPRRAARVSLYSALKLGPVAVVLHAAAAHGLGNSRCKRRPPPPQCLPFIKNWMF